MDDTMTVTGRQEPPSANEQIAILKPDHPVSIGGNRFAPLSLLLSHRDPHCKFCGTSEGWVTVVLVNGKRAGKICGCCVARYKKHVAATEREQTKAETIRIAPLPSEANQQRLERRLTRLSGELAELERELAERATDLEAEISPLTKERNNHQASVQDQASGITRNTAQIRTLKTAIGDTERKLAELRVALRGEEEALKAAEFASQVTVAMIADVDEEIARLRKEFSDRTRRLRRDVDRARARLARARGYNGVETEAIG